MRPTFVTDEDRANQLAAITAFAQAYGYGFVEFDDKHSVIDCIFYKGTKAGALAEVKCRDNARTLYDTLIISQSKIDIGLMIAGHLKLPLLLIIGWTDGLFWIRAEPIPKRCKVRGGNFDKDDPKDYETIYDVPINGFRRVRGLEPCDIEPAGN